MQNRGTGLLIQGAREWRDYTVTADVTPHLAEAVGLAARVQGLRRYYALELAGRDTARLVRHGDRAGHPAVPWEFGTHLHAHAAVAGARLTAQRRRRRRCSTCTTPS